MHFVKIAFLINRIGLFILIASLNPVSGLSQAFLQTPIEGVSNKDWVIVNYVDWSADTANPIQDPHCGSKTYDGHQGTDYTIRSFPQMDSGVNVLAAADGVVTFLIDGLYDRETTSTVSKGLGNYVAIRHNNLYYTYYGHLRKNSLLVKPGDSVKSGDVIAQIGSSGNSTDPHLHFELWYDSSILVDPFMGPCGNPGSLWKDEVNYDTSLHVLESGVINAVPTLDELRERLPENLLFDQNNTSQTPCLWALIPGLRDGDSLEINWYDPSGASQFNYTFHISRDWWYYYFWSYVDHSVFSKTAGTWAVELSRNNAVIARQEFVVSDLSSTDIPIQSVNPFSGHEIPGSIDVYGTDGVLIKAGFSSPSTLLADLPNGIYYLVWRDEGKIHQRKIAVLK